MNALIEEHFDAIELNLLQSPAVTSYQLIRREIAPTDGKLRLKAELCNGGIWELFEYVTAESDQIVVDKYSYHWQDAQRKLMRRWDNAPHFPHLPHAPDHVHQVDGSVAGVVVVPSAFAVLVEIEQAVLS
jgi:Family of unknown function (DUF6516)